MAGEGVARLLRAVAFNGAPVRTLSTVTDAANVRLVSTEAVVVNDAGAGELGEDD